MNGGLDLGRGNTRWAIYHEDKTIQVLTPAPTLGNSILRAKEGLEEIQRLFPDLKELTLGITGVDTEEFGKILGIKPILLQDTWAAACTVLYPDTRTIFEMGLNGQWYVALEKDPEGGLYVADWYDGTRCAAGSGMFIDYMAENMNYPTLQEAIDAALSVKVPSDLSGRCVAFMKTDIVHKYQAGDTREMVAAGIMEAAARNFRSSIVGRRAINDEILYLGGVSQNEAVVHFMRETFQREIRVPEHSCSLGAIGAAMGAAVTLDIKEAIELLEVELAKPFSYEAEKRLRLEKTDYNVLPMEQTVFPAFISADLPKVYDRVVIGLDVGSTSVKAAAGSEDNEEFKLLAYYYGRTNADPIEASKVALTEIRRQFEVQGYKIGKIEVVTTGSGRGITGDYFGAGKDVDEITAQAVGVLHYFPTARTILELGGEDGKILNTLGQVLVNSAMNKACSAGTGTFFERDAKFFNIPIEEFGELALQGEEPVPLDDTCTVFSERSMMYYLAHNISAPNLLAGILIAMVKNFIFRNKEQCEITDPVVFTGAPGFNKGLVAAYETVLDKEILVPPLPHLTGAIGAAKWAFYDADPLEGTFIGFEKMESIKCERGSFTCKTKDCSNRCQVKKVKINDGRTLHYQDRCGMYSKEQRKKKGAHLEDLSAKREEILMSYCATGNPKAEAVGIPRGIMFSEYAPLYTGFIAGLGLNPVISSQTTPKIAKMGTENAHDNLCFMMKVAHGHYLALVEQGVKILFTPSVHETEQPNEKLKSHCCPYVQAAADMIPAYLNLKDQGVKIVSPRLHFNRPLRHLERQFIQAGKELGKSAQLSKKAFHQGLEALKAFRAEVERYAEQVMANLPENQMAIVVIGRPYSLWDPVVNLDIGKIIQDMGILAIPQDFVPLDSQDISDTWPNAYARQVAKKLMAGRFVKRDPRLRALVLTYFYCGPDSFGNDFLSREMDEESFYTVQIDEHTADAGVRTRVQSFIRTVKGQKKEIQKVLTPIRTQESPLSEVGNRRVRIPYLNETARVLKAGLQGYGYNSEVLPRAPLEYLNKAKELVPRDVCVPTLFTLADILYLIDQPDFDASNEAIFQGRSEGPCRFGWYTGLDRLILDQLGHQQIPVVSLGRGNEKAGLGLFFPLVVLIGIMTHDLMDKMRAKVRPYEITPGDADATFATLMNCLEGIVRRQPANLEASFLSKKDGYTGTDHLNPFIELLQRAQKMFCEIPVRTERRPLVGFVGEFYVRLHDGSNQDIIRKAEAAGAETWLAPEYEFFVYISKLVEVLALDMIKDGMYGKKQLREWIVAHYNNWLIAKHEHALYSATLPLLEDRYDIPAEIVIKEGDKDLRYDFGGESLPSIAKANDLIKRGASAIVNVYPVSCMPSNIVNAMSGQIRQRYNNIPFLNVDCNTTPDPSIDSKIKAIVNQARIWEKINR